MKIFKFLSLLFLLLTMVSCSETEQENVYIDPDHEIPDYQNLEWINSDPISIGESIGNGEIVLIITIIDIPQLQIRLIKEKLYFFWEVLTLLEKV